LEYRIIHQDGSLRWHTSNISPIKDADGNLIAVAGIARDTTDRKAAEAALQQKAEDLEQALKQLQSAQSRMIQTEKMSSLGQLVAGVAHEINNPTSFIYSNIEPAENYIEDLLHLINLYQQQYPHPVSCIQDEIEAIDLEFLMADLPKLLSSMKMGAERIKQIVLSLRNFSRMDEAEFKAVNIHEGIDSTLVILEHRLKTQPERPAIAIVKKYGLLPPVECYPGQLNQVFMNILGNAIDALEETCLINQEPAIAISTEAFADEVTIRIADNGVGIPQEVLSRLFDPFFTTKSVGKGTGMGLSISYQIITEKHGGSLRCVSQPNQGAEFIMTIPLRQKN
jgi:two-component system, NtrC family, sensor kinase